MEPFRYHVYACQQEKPGGAPCCSGRGSAAVLDALRKELAAQALLDDVQVTTCGSIGMCERGPNMVVYPEGIWYSGVQVADVPEIVREHFRHGRPVERLANRDAVALKKEIVENRAKAMAALRAAQGGGR
ncbi:MAG TPA: (2Fe-2S) ferredoxin domain-containing protein [Anaeromyxobacteraceae bacterium]|nr:(2Fe-2S) ferredoxin domain-containing protein [Anaeromyxobacteraceae bacterium]